MIHCQFLGSVFRTQNKKPEQLDMESSLVASGLIGRDQLDNLKIIHRPPTALLPSGESQDVSRVKRPTSRRLVTPTSTVRISSRIMTQKPKEQNLPTEHFKPDKLKSSPVKEAPNAYFAKFLPPTTPPSETTFVQLNEILDKITKTIEPEDDPSENMESYNHIFGEIVRQYFIECGSEGQILEKCRQCFIGAKRTIPRILKHYQKILRGITAQQNEKIEQKNAIIPEIDENKLHSKHLLKVIAEMRVDLDRLVRHNDELVKSITVVTNESITMKSSIEQLDKRIAGKNQQLLELNEQLQNLSSIAAQYTSDSINFAENLKTIRQQEHDTKRQVDNANVQLRLAMQKVSRIDAEISVLSSEIEKSRKVSQKHDESAQVDLISRRTFHIGKQKSKNVIDLNKYDQKVIAANLFDQVKREFLISIGKKPEEELEISTYEDFAKLKRVLLKNEEKFHIQPDEIKLAQEGNFELVQTDKKLDLIHLFAAKISYDAVDAAVRGQPTCEIATQTLAQQIVFRDENGNGNNASKKSKFVSIIPTDYSMRSCQQFNWLVPTIRTIYHEKELMNQKAFDEGHPFESFPISIFGFAQNKYPLDFLRDQFCWDVQITSHEMRNQSIECEMFVDFLDEKFNEEQLAFFLLCRKDCLKSGCSVPVKSRDLLETYNEYYLSLDQVELLLPQWWQHRYQRKFYLKLLDFSVPRPAIHLEATKRYIAMHDVLQQCVLDYIEDTTTRLHEILLVTRIVPRLRMPEFTKLMKSLVPEIKQQMILDFYRATVSKGFQRKEVTVNQFIDMFFQSSILNAFCQKNDVTVGDKDMIDAVNSEYGKNINQFNRMLDFFKQQSDLQPDNLTLKTYYDDATRFFSMLTHSLTSSDGRGCCTNYYQFIFSLDILFSSLGILDISEEEQSLISLECSVRENWLDTVFGQKQKQ